MIVDTGMIQLFVAGLVVVAALAALAAALPKKPPAVELTMHVDRGAGRALDIVVRGTEGDVEEVLAGIARRVADGNPATVLVGRPGDAVPVGARPAR